MKRQFDLNPLRETIKASEMSLPRCFLVTFVDHPIEKRLSGGGSWLISILLKMQFARSWYVELYTRNSKRAPHFSKLMLRNEFISVLQLIFINPLFFSLFRRYFTILQTK